MQIFKIEFEDKGQDLLRLECDAETGVITDVGPFHRGIYADGNHFIDVSKLNDDRVVYVREGEGVWRTFNWLAVRLSQDGVLLAEER